MGMIIAMKGHPGTGKSTLATAIASALGIPLLDKDDVRDSTLSLQDQGVPSSLLNDLSYAAIWRLAATQLRLGLSLVLDSPLSRRPHLDRLLALRHPVLIVECRPRDWAEWRRRLEHRAAAAADSAEGWHKPASWRDMERLMEGYGGCTEYDVGDVPRIVVDTTEEGVGVEELLSAVLHFIRSCGGGPYPSELCPTT